jgi:hypothetical protein
MYKEIFNWAFFENSNRHMNEGLSGVKIRMKTHKLTLLCEYSKQACYTFKFHPEIKILLKLGCQQTTCITNKTRHAIKKKISLTNEIEN